MTVRRVHGWRGWLAASLSLAAAVLVLSVLAPSAAQRALVSFETDRLAIETAGGQSHAFTVELARTPEQKAQGLMLRR
ncbi:MAG: hypothetical protein ACREDZ_15250, partial [Kiloniellales bacterium]